MELRDAIKWQGRHVALIKDGGFWIIPRSEVAIRIDHANKCARWQYLSDEESGNLDSSCDAARSAETCPEEMVAEVFRAMGWRFERDEEPITPRKG